jgi:amino acid adenylation domain-containing protein
VIDRQGQATAAGAAGTDEHVRFPDLTIAPPPCTQALVHARFVDAAARHPARTAIVTESGATLSYGALLDASARLAGKLRRAGIGPGKVVAIVSGRNAACVAAMLAVLRAGAAFALVDASYPRERVKSHLALAWPSFVILIGVGETHRGAIAAGLTCLALPVDVAGLREGLASDEPEVAADVDPRGTAYLMFTSGSTGTPKCIATAHAPLPHFIAWHEREFGLSADDRFSMLSGLSHDPLLRDVFTPLSIGATLAVPRQEALFDPDLLCVWMRAQAVTVCHLTPQLGNVILAGARGQPIGALRRLFWGGDALRPSLVTAVRAVAPAAAHVNFYGTTETPQAVAFHRVEGWPAGDGDPRIPIGRGIDGVDVVVLDGDRRLAPVGVEGEVGVRTRYLSLGYVGDPEGTRQKFVANPGTGDAGDVIYLTGDQGRYLADGAIELVGRKDDQVKIRGYRVELEEVARALRAYPGVRDALVLAQGSPSGEMRLCAYVVPDDGAPLTSTILSAHARGALPRHMLPSSYALLDRFPLLPNGKVDRAALRALSPTSASAAAAEPRAADAAGGAPRTEREKTIAAVWCDALGVPAVSTTESFFDLGGDSLTAVRVLIRMRLLGLDENVCRGIFRGQTIAEIASGAGAAREQADARPLDDRARHRLVVNVLRGLLVIDLVAAHWGPSVLRRLGGPLAVLGDYLNAIYNAVTPGFALAFGTSLGFIYFPLYRADARRARRILHQGAVMVGAATLLFAGVRLLMNRIDPGRPWNAFDNVLPYYAVALAGAPLWMAAVARARFTTPARAAVALALLSWAVYGAVPRSWLGPAVPADVAMFTLGKYSYFNLSFGALAGLAVGVVMHDGRRVPPVYAMVGAVMIGAALVVESVISPPGKNPIFMASSAIEPWKWLLYGGLFLAALAAIDRTLAGYHALPRPWQLAARLVGVLGQLALPVFLVHFFATDLGNVVSWLGGPAWADVGSGLLFFVVVTAPLVRRVYRLYYASEPAAGAWPVNGSGTSETMAG